MKIAILTENMRKVFGVDLVVHEQARRMSKDHEVAVHAIQIDKQFVKDADYEIEQLDVRLHFNPLKQDWYTFSGWKKYKEHFSDFDIFVLQTPTYNAWLPFLKNLGHTVVYYHGNSPSYGWEGKKKYRKQIFDHSENFFYFNFPHQIISISEFLKNELHPRHRKKTVVIPHGSDHIIERRNKITSQTRNKILGSHDVQDEDILITYIGRLDYRDNRYKNTLDLIKLAQKLPKEMDNRRIRIFGIGLPENNIEKEMRKAGMTVVPKASNDELITILESSYVYFSPSLWEGFNLPFIEAQRLGVPVVGYDLAAHPEVVVNKRTGYLVDDFEEVYQRIVSLIDSPNIHEGMSVRAKEHASKFTWDRNVDELVRVIANN